MKKSFVKLLLILMSFVLLAALPCNAKETAKVTEFSDVPEDHWAYQTIMKMTDVGIFKGTTEPVNGVGKFSPSKEMTRAQFITASLRAIYPDEAKNIENGKAKWWDSYYAFALEKGIVKESELDKGNLDKPMSREEMAMIMVRCVERNGEKLTQRIKTSQISDYAKIGNYYKDYVLDCFSFGLLCGVDDTGRFEPTKTLKRSEASTVICRLIYEDMRVDVEFIEDSDKDPDINKQPDNSSDDNKQEGSTPGGSYVPPSSDDQKDPEPEEKVDYPWENGGKKPADYTWAEYEALPESMKNAFYESFESEAAFEKWFNKVTQSQKPTLPWENGGKKPSDYTWAEYEALPESIKNAFYESFESEAAFEKWFNKVTQSQKPTLPWENGGKKPADYTWEEFNSLSDSLKEAFVNSFHNPGDFADWLDANQP